jgi:hypothetical protein
MPLFIPISHKQMSNSLVGALDHRATGAAQAPSQSRLCFPIL